MSGKSALQNCLSQINNHVKAGARKNQIAKLIQIKASSDTLFVKHNISLYCLLPKVTFYKSRFYIKMDFDDDFIYKKLMIHKLFISIINVANFFFK